MKYTKIRDVKDPSGNRKEDCGVDLFLPNDWNNGKPMRLYIGKQVKVPSGIKVKVPFGSSLTFENKSGVALKKGLVCGAVLVDPAYRGEVNISLFKVVRGTEDKRDWLGRYYTVLTPGEKIVQGVIYKCSQEAWNKVSEKVYDQGPATKRSTGGFGSTGTK